MLTASSSPQSTSTHSHFSPWSTITLSPHRTNHAHSPPSLCTQPTVAPSTQIPIYQESIYRHLQAHLLIPKPTSNFVLKVFDKCHQAASLSDATHRVTFLSNLIFRYAHSIS